MNHLITKPMLIVSSSLALLAWLTLPVRAESDLHQGKYQKNLTYQGPKTGDEIIYTLYLPPGYDQRKGPYPLIFFLHGAGGGNASAQVLQSYESARKAGAIGDFIVVFPEKYGGTVWRDGAKGKRPETNVLRELLPHLEKKYALSSIEAIGPSWASMGAAGSIYWGAGTSIFSPSPSLSMREEGPVSRFHCEKLRTRVWKRTQQIVPQPSTGPGRLDAGVSGSFDKLGISYEYRSAGVRLPGWFPLPEPQRPSRKFLHNPSA